MAPYTAQPQLQPQMQHQVRRAPQPAYQPPRRQATCCPEEVRNVNQNRQQRQPRSKRPVCLDYLKGVCHLKRWKCKYAHPPLPLLTAKKQTPNQPEPRSVCEVYMLTGFCKFGDNCRDYHPTLTGATDPICAPAKVKSESEEPSISQSNSCNSLHSTDSEHGSETASHATSEGSGHSCLPPSPKSNLDAAMRKVNGILNRLTPEKFDSLLQQLFELLTGDQAEACLTRVLPLVFARAINETHMCELYARLTKHLYSLVGSDEQPILQEQLLTLSSSLLYKVDDVYQAVKEDAEQLGKLQSKRLGNVQFFAELVRLDTLPYFRLHSVIAYLFQQCSLLQGQGKSSEADFHIELLCRLLTTIGGDLNPHRAISYVQNLQQIVHRHSTRVQMLVMNVIDLCFQKGWRRENDMQNHHFQNQKSTNSAPRW